MRTIRGFLVAGTICTIGYAAQAHINGQNASTQKSGNFGCDCHAPERNTETNVVITSDATSFQRGQTYDLMVTVSNPGETSAGVDIAAYRGTLTAGSGLRKTGGELVHSAPKVLQGGSTSWSFKYTPPSTGVTDTLYATGNAVNGNGNADAGDAWNFSNKFVVHVDQSSVRQDEDARSMRIELISNPTLDAATVRITAMRSEDVNLELVDLAGRSVRAFGTDAVHPGGYERRLDLRGLASGGYILRVLSGQAEPRSFRLLVKH